MNKNIIAGLVAGSVVAATVGGLYAIRKLSKKHAEPQLRLVSETASLQSVVVQEDPEQVSTELYEQYKTLAAFVNSEEAKHLRLTKQVRSLHSHGVELVEDAQTLLDITQVPEAYVSKNKHERATIYVTQYAPADTAVIVVKFADFVWTLTMPTNDRFVASGPLFKNCDSFGYLSVLLSALLETWVQ